MQKRLDKKKNISDKKKGRQIAIKIMSMKLPPILLLMAINVALYSQQSPTRLRLKKRSRDTGSPIHGFLRTKSGLPWWSLSLSKGNTSANSDIWMYEIESKTFYQFTWSPKSDNNPKWSPDSKSLAFLSSRGGESQVYLITFRGGEASPLTKSKTSVKDFEWSPDGKTIAYLAPELATDDEEKKPKNRMMKW